MRVALTSKEHGRAIRVPNAPKTQPHKSRETKDMVGVSPTASPANFGWMIDWMTKFSTE